MCALENIFNRHRCLLENNWKFKKLSVSRKFPNKFFVVTFFLDVEHHFLSFLSSSFNLPTLPGQVKRRTVKEKTNLLKINVYHEVVVGS